MSKKPFYVDWNAKDALDGMNQLSDFEELAYRRIIDMIYVTDDQLLDDEQALQWSTKTGKKWSKIRKRLLELGKIEIIERPLNPDSGFSGTCKFISNKKCRDKLSDSKARIEQ